MAMTKLAIFALTVLMASITAAVAKVDRACMREARETFGTGAGQAHLRH
jgi:hypothetical protein